MIEASCYLCGSADALTLCTQDFADPYLSLVDARLNAVSRRWLACRACGFVYRSPTLSQSERETLYRNYGDDVFGKETPDAYFDRIAGLPAEKSENHAKAVWLKERLEEFFGVWPSGDLPVLDVGCGAGLLSHKMGTVFPSAVRVCGVELNSDYAALAARRADVDVLRVEYRPGLFDRKFPLVTCTKVLEHVADPVAFVKMLAEDVSDGGALFLEVPDVADFSELPVDHAHFLIPHLYFFPPHAMEEILARCGLGMIASRSVRTGSGRHYLQALASRARPPSHGNPPYDDAESLLKKRREKFRN